MTKFQPLKTNIKGLELVPLAEKHINFLVELLSEPTIQKTLFRTKTAISREKQATSLPKMYEKEKPAEITYILTLKSLLSEKYIGYVKIKLIDWAIHNCYISIAIADNPDYRGKGYAKATYDAFIPYLFSLGLKKIYGRTYENNIPTIKLNYATGFKLIGRQSYFISYPNGTSSDALFFENVAPEIEKSERKPDDENQKKICEVLNHAAVNLSKCDLKDTLSHTEMQSMPLSAYFKKLSESPIDFFTINQQLTQDTVRTNIAGDMRDLLEKSLPKDWHVVLIEDEPLVINYSEREVCLPKNVLVSHSLAVKLTLIALRYNNAEAAKLPMLGYLTTQDQLTALDQLTNNLIEGNVIAIGDDSLSCNALTPETATSLSYLFLGRTLRHNWKDIIPAIVNSNSKAPNK